jgi:hypothetical protein
MLEDGHESGHGDEVDLVALRGRRPTARCRPAGRSRSERLALDELDRDPGALGDVDRSARPVDDDDADGKGSGDQRLENRPASRRQHPDPPHIGKLPEGRVAPRDLASAGTRW